MSKKNYCDFFLFKFIPIARTGYEVFKCGNELAITKIISSKRECNNCFIKNVPTKIKIIAPQEIRRTLIRLVKRGIMTHNPYSYNKWDLFQILLLACSTDDFAH